MRKHDIGTYTYTYIHKNIHLACTTWQYKYETFARFGTIDTT